MNIKNIEINRNAAPRSRRVIASQLDKILLQLPIDIFSTGPLMAHVGLGKIIYIEPIDGEISSIQIDGLTIDATRPLMSQGLIFEYNHLKYCVKYKRGF